jgi:hypothetical protein
MLERERERDGTHTFRKVAMCKWQMDDPEAQVKSSLSDCTWLEDLSMDTSRYLRTYEAKRTEEHLYIYIFLLLFYFVLIFLSLSFFLFYFSFLFISFFIFHFFSFAH